MYYPGVDCSVTLWSLLCILSNVNWYYYRLIVALLRLFSYHSFISKRKNSHMLQYTTSTCIRYTYTSDHTEWFFSCTCRFRNCASEHDFIVIRIVFIPFVMFLETTLQFGSFFVAFVRILRFHTFCTDYYYHYWRKSAFACTLNKMFLVKRNFSYLTFLIKRFFWSFASPNISVQSLYYTHININYL